VGSCKGVDESTRTLKDPLGYAMIFYSLAYMVMVAVAHDHTLVVFLALFFSSLNEGQLLISKKLLKKEFSKKILNSMW